VKPGKLPVATARFSAPDGLDETQVAPIEAFLETVPSGNNLEGASMVVVAWKPSPEEIQDLIDGGQIYLSCLGGLPAHFLTTKFKEATYGLESD
jgi:hypothetical protein